ncbi:hypothetical protein PINS_up002535 [Pythium insidiosum]|nr:hypothetical protein PINS_up002535 [Pythium insidiosum]
MGHAAVPPMASMETPRRSVAVVPPSGSRPAERPKSLRQLRANNGASLIKAYVTESEQRREQSRFNSGPGSSLAIALSSSSSAATRRDDVSMRTNVERDELCSPTTVRSPTHPNQERESAGNALEALFSNRRRLHRFRQASLPRHAPAAAEQTHQSDGSPLKSIPRRRLHTAEAAASVQGGTSFRAPIPAHLPRSKQSLAAKLDAMSRSSLWGRRKVVLSEEKSIRNMLKPASPRHAAPSTTPGAVVDTNNTGSNHKELSQSDLETKVMTAFRRIVRLWRERKRKAEAAAVDMMNGNSNGLATGTGRNGSKFRKDLTAQSSNVVGILSRRMVREVPALKFFDDDDAVALPVPPSVVGAKRTVATTVASTAAAAANAADRARPRGVCYTLDANGCRKIKMQSSALQPSRQAGDTNRARSRHANGPSSDEITIEKAMGRSIRRKMARRLKTRRQTLLRLTDDFSKTRRELSTKLRTQLALQRAEMDTMFPTRLVLLSADDPSLPPYRARKELQLARLRCKKASLLERCQTLRVLGLVLQRIDDTGQKLGQDASAGEQLFLDLLRCVVEDDHVLPPSR